MDINMAAVHSAGMTTSTLLGKLKTRC
uniref:Uncharacterized protein n=1 Tax=Anguilla anguilla TaxID=7936 RepID=A0A0E9Q5P4_ANGAN